LRIPLLLHDEVRHILHFPFKQVNLLPLFSLRGSFPVLDEGLLALLLPFFLRGFEQGQPRQLRLPPIHTL